MGIYNKATRFADLMEEDVFLYTLYMYKGVIFRRNANNSISKADTSDKVFVYSELLCVPTPKELLRLCAEGNTSIWFDENKGVVCRHESGGLEFWNGDTWEEVVITTSAARQIERRTR